MVHKSCYGGMALVMLAALALTAQAALTGQYLFENNALDSSGNGRDGTIEGGAVFTTGLYHGSSQSLLQTAVGQSVALPADQDFIRNAPGATVMAWVRPDALDSASHTILAVNNADATSGGGLGAARALLQLQSSSFRLLGRQADSGGETSIVGHTALAGETYLMAGVLDYAGQTMTLYINGSAAAQKTNITAWTLGVNSSDTANLAARIGAGTDGTSEHFIGAIDGARIFDHAMAVEDILSIYAAEGPLPGDANGDRDVNLADLAIIRLNWRATGKTRAQGNLTLDTQGLVDFSDFRQWKTAYLAGGGSLEGVNFGFLVVPEPSTFVLASVCVLLLGCVRRRMW